MADNILTLHKKPPQADIVAGLRKLADNIEAGTVEGMPVITTVVCMLGHTDDKLQPDGSIDRNTSYDKYVWGTRGDALTVHGLLTYGIAR